MSGIGRSASRRATICLAVCELSLQWAGAGAADAVSASNPSSAVAAAANQLLTEQFGPFKFSVGQDSNAGGIGANLDGEGVKNWHDLGFGTTVQDVERLWFPSFASLGYAATGNWGSAQAATNNASLSLKPGIDGALAFGTFHDNFDNPNVIPPVNCASVCTDTTGKVVPPDSVPKFYLGAGAAGDLELRYGTFKQNGSTVAARELLVGAQIYTSVLQHNWDFGVVRVLAAPRINGTYYHAITATGTRDIAVPSGVKIDYIQTELETVIGFGSSAASAVKLDLKYDGSKPTTGDIRVWENLWTVKVWIPSLQFNGINPTVTYQTGKNGGFTYDKQVLIGVLMEFLDPAK